MERMQERGHRIKAQGVKPNMQENGPDTRGMERFNLIIFSVFDIMMFVGAIRMDWPIWIPVIMVVLMFLGWTVLVLEIKDFHSRVIMYAYIMQIALIIYVINLDDLFAVSANMICFAVLTGLYGVSEACGVYALGTIFIFLYFFSINISTGFGTEVSFFRIFTQVFYIVAAEYTVYIWVKNRTKSANRMISTISALKAAEQSKNDFLANISHEIRTPVNTIYGMSELIMQAQDLEDVKNQVYDVQTAGRNLMSVVTDIMDFTDLQFGKMEMEEEEYNITSTLNDVINMSMAIRKEKHIELIVNCDANMPRLLLGDEKKIRRVIMNLVSNAVKFTNEGCVVINVGMRRESYGINLIVKVKDTGIGMKEEDLEKIFTSFNQVDTKRNRQEGGIGLGMAISKAIVDKMGGVISIRSKMGEGTLVTAVMPQKILDDQPIIHVDNAEKIHIALYINLEQFEIAEIRGEFAANIQQMFSQLPTEGHSCRNLTELKRRVETGEVTHVFVGRTEYQEDPAYFNELAEKIKVILIIDHFEEKFIETDEIIRLYKPFYILPLISVLNNESTEKKVDFSAKKGKFVAPDVHVLVVDDNVMNIKVIQGLLSNYRIHVTSATSGKEALEKIESRDYDFVFMDHMMPEMDGVETLHQIRKKSGAYFHKVPVIALTANAIAGVRGMFLAEGFADFVEKPVESSVLERVLRRNLPEEKLLSVDDKDAEREDGGQTKIPAESGSAEGAKGSDAEEAADIQIGDLDVEKGLIYCGGKEQYLEILKLYNDTAAGNLDSLERLFEKEDWNDYIINVHAVKSSMMSIGATKLSGLAKGLELAGKSGDLQYIRQNHQDMVEEYKRVIQLLKDFHKGADVEESDEALEQLPEIFDVEFDRMVSGMEDAMYGLDDEKMMQIADELQKYKYHGKVLEKEMTRIRRKIEMSDYMSAVESLHKLKEKIKAEEGGEDV